MSNTPHDLYEDFPGKAEIIHALKAKDAHFARMVEAYHEVNRAVHRAETRVVPTSSEHEAELRQQRMRLKDAIFRVSGVARLSADEIRSLMRPTSVASPVATTTPSAVPRTTSEPA